MRVNSRELAKSVARAAASILVAPWAVSFSVRAACLGRDRALEGSSQLLSMIPGVAGEYMRRAFFQHALAACHKTVVIGFGATFSRAGSRLDENVYIGPGSHLGLIHAERDVLIAAGVHIPSGTATHGIEGGTIPIRDLPGSERLIRLGAGAWIGESAVVMADVGAGTVVGAGAVVTRPLPDGVVAAGIPARVLRSRYEKRAAV
jgi:acetyltransferase-like isoleucine patch superfamily enzyme